MAGWLAGCWLAACFVFVRVFGNHPMVYSLVRLVLEHFPLLSSGGRCVFFLFECSTLEGLVFGFVFEIMFLCVF